MAQKKNNVSKKIPKNLSGSMPYFHINNLGQIQHFDMGGELPVEPASTKTIDFNDLLSTLSGGGIGSTVGNTLSNMIGGNTNIAEDRNANKGAATLGGVFEGMGTGVDIGSKVGGPLGVAAGALIGGVAGGINAATNKEKEIEAFKASMAAKYKGLDPMTTQYYGAYGIELPDMKAFGGGLEDPPTKSNLNDPSYEAQLKAYQISLTNGPASNLTATAEADLLKKFMEHRDKNQPLLAGLNINKLVYDPTTLDATTGLPSQYLEYFDAPNKNPGLPKPTAIMPEESKVLPVMLDASTGKPLKDAPLMDVNQQIPRQYSQALEQMHNTKEALEKRAVEEEAIRIRKEEIANTSPEELRIQRGDLTRSEQIAKQRAEFQAANQKALGGPIGEELKLGGEGTNFNGNSHEAGGIKIGNTEVEDGEVRVGDYVFSDRLINESGRTYAAEAKKILKKFEEYPTDGPAKRTQNKMLEEIKFQNDQARLLKQKEDAEMRMIMQEDFAAYGGMIQKDSKGKIIVDKSNRMQLLDAARNRKMSYNKYVESIFAYGGSIKEGIDPNNNVALGLNMETPLPPNDLNLMDFGLGPDLSSTVKSNLDFSSNDFNFMETPLPSTVSRNDTDKNFLQKLKENLSTNFNEEEQALLSSQLPNISQLLLASKKSDTVFDRVDLKEVNLNTERAEVKDSVNKGLATQRANVRGNATSSGEALAALSAGAAELTKAEMDAMTGISERERNVNIQTQNQEDLTNLSISNQETIARQQDDAMRDSVKQLALSGMSDNYQGYIKDKKMTKENEASNKRLLSLLDTGEYEIVEDGEGGYKVVYKTNTTK